MSKKLPVRAPTIMSASSPALPPHASTAVDRRTFLGAVSATAGALVTASVVPLSVAAAQDLGESAHGIGAESRHEWHVDDMWGHRPRYAHAIPYGPARTSPVLWEHVDPIDRALIV
ncbi:MAG TPA: twin-arginine translocation signal domain-containing protein [Steroidobacteraceae bacterium]|nr:twin-arginine translocation signal domain-containing protein [Steroidobacteraceae bacterium]